MAANFFNAKNGLSVGTLATASIATNGDIAAVALTTTGNITVASTKFIVNSSTGALTVTGDITVNTDKCTITASSGQITVASTAGVSAGKIAVTGSTAPAIGIYTSAANTLTFSSNSGNQMSLDANGDLIVPHTNTNTSASTPNMYVDSNGKFYKSTATLPSISDVLAFAIALG